MRYTYLATMFMTGVATLATVVAVGLGIRLYQCNKDTIASTPAYCDYPPSKECKPYIEEMESWIKESMKSDKQWENCTRDLIRCQDEMNQDTLCITPDCQ